MNREYQTIIAYLAVGFLGFCANMFTLTLALAWGIEPKRAIVCGIVVSTLLNFLLDRVWVFPNGRQHPLAGQFIGFVFVCILGALVNYSVAISLLSLFSPHVAELFGIIVGTVFNYFLLRFMVFK